MDIKNKKIFQMSKYKLAALISIIGGEDRQ